MDRRIRWGILGAGSIAHRFAASLLAQADRFTSELVGVSARRPEAASAFAHQFQVPQWFCSHVDLLESGIDAVYIALPHHLHSRWAVAALSRGIAVLTEKPAGISQDEVAQMVEASRVHRTLLMEGMKSRMVPASAHIMAAVDSCIGQLRHIDAAWENPIDPGRIESSYLSAPGYGGALLDSGCYLVSWVSWLMPDMHPTQVSTRDGSGFDFATSAWLENRQGQTARISCAMDLPGNSGVRIVGTKGTIHIPLGHRPTSFTVLPAGVDAEPIVREYGYELPGSSVGDDFSGEIDVFCSALRSGALQADSMPHAASLDIARIMDEIREF